MKTLDFCNYCLSLIGEQPLLSTAGNLGQLTRNAIYSSTLAVVQSSRATYFESILTATATNVDYLVPAFELPVEVAQVLDVWAIDINSNLINLRRQELQTLNTNHQAYTYDIVGSKVYLSPLLARPVNLRIKALVIPTLPEADDADIGIPKPLHPAIAHGAASILCVSYVDDSNAAAQHKRMADELTLLLRQQFGSTRGRTFNIGNAVQRFYA